MPVGLLVFYRLLGVLLWVLIFSMLWEKYRIVRGGTLLPAQILDCCRSGRGDAPMTGEMERHTRRDGFFNPPRGRGRLLLPRIVFRQRPADGTQHQ